MIDMVSKRTFLRPNDVVSSIIPQWSVVLKLIIEGELGDFKRGLPEEVIIDTVAVE